MKVHVRAPGRVNLIGDHTDYTGGRVFPIAIDRWTEIVGTTSDRIRLASADEDGIVDLALRADPTTITPPWGRFVAAVPAELDIIHGLSGTVTTTIPVGAGLSSSAALELATALALGFTGSPIELAEIGQRAEHRATGVPTGIMDQLCIAAAREGQASLIDCQRLEIRHVPVPDDVKILVRYITHRTLEGSEYGERVRQCQAAEAAIGPLRCARIGDVDRIDDRTVRRRARHVISENARVDSFAAAIAAGNYDTAGALMTESHRSLRDDFATSTTAMDNAVDDLVQRRSVYGARMTGGGFGGCVVAICRPDSNLDGWTVRPVGGAVRLEPT